MSDGFPSGSCADVILSRGGAVEAAGRFPACSLVSGKGHTMCEFLTRCAQESRALWITKRKGLSMVVLGLDGERSG